MKTSKVETPELNKMKAVKERSQTIGRFVDWLRDDKGIVLAERESPHFRMREPRLFPCTLSIEQLLAEFFGIDLQKVDDERLALLDEMRQEQG